MLQDICGEDNKQQVGKDGEPISGLMTLQFVPPNQFIRRDIVKATVHTSADVAVAGVGTLKHKETGAILRNKVLRLTKVVPRVGDYVATWAFPNAVHEIKGNNGTATIIPKIYEGKITKEYRDGRDSVMMPGPCYETTLSLQGGSSGGPVFNENGFVFAINSTGLDGADVGHVSHIQRLGGLPVFGIKTEDGKIINNMTVHELILQGQISVEGYLSK